MADETDAPDGETPDPADLAPVEAPAEAEVADPGAPADADVPVDAETAAPEAAAAVDEPAADAGTPDDADADADVGVDAAADDAEPAAPDADADADADDAEAEPADAAAEGAIPGAHLDVDLVLEAEAPQRGDAYGYVEDDAEAGEGTDEDEDLTQPILDVSIDLGTSARYRATGKRKRAIARVTLRPGTGAYAINGRELDVYFPRPTLRRSIRQALEVVGYDEQLDVVATITGSGTSAQADALRHGISRALLVAQPNLRGELKKRGFLTRDARAVERKKAGLKKARKRPQFSKR